MTVTYKGIIPESRSATNRLGVRTYTEVHRLTTDSRTDTAYVIGSNANLPVIGETYTDDPLAWCTELQVQCTDGYTGWTVTANYSSEFEIGENPLNEPARITIDGEKYQEVADVDRNGDAVLNSAGDWFVDPPVMRDKTRRILRISKNISEWPGWLIEDSDDYVNSAAFVLRGRTIPERVAKLENANCSEKQTRNGIDYYVLTFDLHLNRATWNAQPLQAGYYSLVAGVPKKITMSDGTDPTVPQLLDASGVKITSLDPADAIYASFEIYNELDFSTLPLD